MTTVPTQETSTTGVRPGTGDRTRSVPAQRPTYERIPLRRVVGVELRKMFDTRSGYWLMMSIGILAVLASAAVVVFAPAEEITYESFASAIGIPMSIVLPVIAILSVTAEWTQRNGLTTFTLVPHRGRVIGAKAICTVLIGVVSMVAAMVIGAVGNVVGSALAGVSTTWNLEVADLLYIVLANVLGMLIGFMLGVVIRNSPGAIVGYFVYAFVLPTISGILAATQEWFRDVQHWVDFQYNQVGLYEGGLSASEWGHLAVTGSYWLLLPTAVGVWLVLRSEVK